MSHGRPDSNLPEPSLIPSEGWHCLHLYYRFDRQALSAMPSDEVAIGCEQLRRLLDDDHDHRTERLQVSIVSGHKADFGLMLMDPDPLKIDRIPQSVAASPLGKCLLPTYSFVSLSEISEYVPTLEEYAEKLRATGTAENEAVYEAKIKAYAEREPMMRRQRLTPDFPAWPATCFYPMNKKRKVGENWFMLSKDERKALMSEHARSGMQFAGKVTQLITVGVGLDDWEWGVTLWARNPEYLKDIVYQMRFDEASARYAEFGPFYTSYISSAAEMLSHCHISKVAVTQD